jgi:hypothetical protein
MDFEPGIDKNQTRAIHDLIQAQLEEALEQFPESRALCQKALMRVDTLNIFIDFDNTYDSYLSLCQNLRTLCQGLALEDRLLKQISERFGKDCFFLSCFLNQA